MRTLDDIVNVKFTFTGLFKLDKEELEDNPMWQNILYTSRSEDDAIKTYVREYLQREDFPTNTPATTGPADILGMEVEVIHGRK